MIIARAEEEDLERILSIQRQAYQSEAKLYDDFTIPPLRQTLEELRAEFRLKVFLKAVHELTLLGSVRVSLSERTCLVERLIVDPAAEGRGIGSALLSAAEAVYPEVQAVELFTGTQSARNLKFYEKRGYVRTHEKVLSERVTLVYLRKLPLPNQAGSGNGAGASIANSRPWGAPCLSISLGPQNPYDFLH